MRSLNQRLATVRVTTLAAALMGVYGVAMADTDPPVYTWKVIYDNKTETVDDASFTPGIGKNMRAVLSTGGSTITLNRAIISTDAGDSFGAHGASAYGDTSKLNIIGGTITTTGQYSNGIQAENGGTVTGNGVGITSTGGSSYTFGVEAGDGGKVDLTGGTIDVSGEVAAGARAYTGAGKSRRGEVHLNGTNINVSGARSIGLMAGDTDGNNPATAGNITYKNGTVTAQDGAAARVIAGSTLTLEKATLTATTGKAISASDVGSTVTATQSELQSTGTGTGGGLVIAVYAKNGAKVDLTGGSVSATGAQYTRGIVAETGSTVKTTGTAISTTGNSSHAVQAHVESSNAGEDVPIIEINGGSINVAGEDSWGLFALRGGQITSSANITTSGRDGFGVFVESNGESGFKNGKITLNGGSVTTTGEKRVHGSHAVIAKHAGNTVDINSTAITTTRDYASGLLAELGGSITAKNATISTEGQWAFGANATGGGKIALDGGTVTTKNPKGKGVQDGDGSRAYALQATGAGSKVTTRNGTAILTEGQRAYGAYAIAGGEVDLSDSSIETHGFMAYGAYASGTGSKLTTNNVNITTTGDVGDAVWAYNGGHATINGGVISVAGGMGKDGETGNGLTAVGGTSGVGNGVIIANGVTVTTTGADSTGILAGSDIGTARTTGTVSLSNTSITAKGPRATAAHVLYGSVLNATNNSKLISVQGDGIVMSDNATVNLDATRLEAKGASLVSKLQTSGQRQDITIGSGSNLTVNNGTLLQVNRSAAGMDGIVNLNLKAGSVSAGSVIDMDGLVAGGSGERTQGGKTNFNLETGAQWAGIIWGVNDASTGDGATFVDEGGAPIAGNVLGGENSIITFKNGATIGGGVQTGSGSTATFNGPTSIGGTVLGTGSNYVFSQSAPTTIGGSVVLNVGSTLKGGTIATPITIEGDAAVGTGSTLGGNLNVKGALSGSGGTLSPGNSVGTQIYGSSAEFAGAYNVEVNAAGKSDLIVISNGNFDLSNVALTVGQENGNGGYILNHDYTIVQTPGGEVKNNFKPTPGLDASFAGTLVKLDPVKYGTKDVKVSLSVDNAAAQAKRAGLSGNQNATLDGVLSVAGLNTAADAALQSTDTAGSMNQLSGEAHASTSSALLAAGGLVQRTVAQRMRGNLGAGMLAGAPTAQAGGAPAAGSMPQSAALPLWAQVVGNWSTLSDDGNAAKVHSDVGGVFVGGDAAVGSGWRVGGALGFTDGRIHVDDRSSRTKARSYTASLYGGNSWATGKGSVNFLAGAAYTRHNLDSRRSITLAGGQTLTADYHAHSTQLFTELGYALPFGASSVIEPYAGLAWLSQRMQGFSESGGSAALRGDSQTDSVTTFTLGLRGKTSLELSAGKRVTLFAGLGWRHASGDVTPGRNMAFVQGNGASFQVSGAPIAKNAALLDAGMEASIGRNAALGLSYNGQFGSGNTNHVGSLYVKMRF